MKYGKLEDVSDVDFEMLPEDLRNSAVLPGAAAIPDVRLGGTMWNIPAWKGSWFPAGARPADFLRYYSRLFSTIELNATHYRTPEPETVRKWKSETPRGFMFSPKFPQAISHYRRFVNCGTQTDAFLNAIVEFGDQLGPAFIQLPPHFSPGSADALMAYVRALPSDLHLALEFRHPDWFMPDNRAAEEVWSMMRERAVTAVVSDTSGRRDAVHMRLTSPHCIVRFGGNALHPTDYARLSDWLRQLKRWSESGLKSFHLWMHQPESLVTPETCAWFAEEWFRISGNRITAPEPPAQPSLF
jgi:uncharacterized protein YecE (DUF72 family)